MNLTRVFAVIAKEFAQMRRDRLTFGTMLAVPIMQLILFGYAINVDPRDLPAAVLLRDDGPMVRSILIGLENTGYYDIDHEVYSAPELDELIRTGVVQFAIEVPANFERDVLRGEHPQILVIADATDPAATGGAVGALPQLAAHILDRDLRRPPEKADRQTGPPFSFTVHRRYNPASVTQYNIVPGLLGVVLTMTMMMFTALAVTREIERGTMESLLAMPVQASEIMLGKVAPYVIIGLFQAVLIVGAAHLLFGVPIEGSLALLAAMTGLFVLANLAVGYTFSTVAGNQLQAVQMTFLFFLPNILLSGFMFPFRGMPVWAQWIGECLPLTHFLRIVRGIMLKGNGFEDMIVDTAAIVAFVIVAMAIALARFRQTLD